MLMNFVNYGTDMRILKSMDRTFLEELEKSRPGTVPTPVFISHTSDGKAPHWTTRDKKIDTGDKSSHSKSTVNYFSAKHHKVFSFDEIKNHYNNLPKDKQRGGLDEYIKRNYFISDGKTTTSRAYIHHSDSTDDKMSRNHYQSGRFKYVHKPAIDRILAEADSPPEGIKPMCFMFGGGSASGKSTVVNSIVAPLIKQTGLRFANVDCDVLKEDIPEYDLCKKENIDTAAMRVHRESSDLCMECIDALIKHGKCFTYDGVMGDYHRTAKLVDILKDNGYDVYVYATDVPTDLAIERANKRERKINEDIIRNAHNTFAQAFPATMELPITHFALYDNSQPEGQPPTLIVDSTGVKDQSLYDKFIQKGEEASYR